MKESRYPVNCVSEPYVEILAVIVNKKSFRLKSLLAKFLELNSQRI